MPSCPACRSSLPPGGEFCDQCGAALAKVCTRCDARLAADSAFCEACGLALGETSGGPRVPPPGSTPTGLLRRSLAKLVDWSILLFLAWLLYTWLEAGFERKLAGTLLDPEGRRYAELWLDHRRVCLLLGGFGPWLYFALLEASPLAGTPGKRLLGSRLAVAGTGERAGILRCLLRGILKLVSLLPCFGGYLLAVVHPRGATLHDWLSGTEVVRLEATEEGSR